MDKKKLKKAITTVLALLTCLSLASCGSAPATGGGSGTEEGTYTASGYEYRANVDERSASIEYLDATLDIDDAEFVTDDFDDQTYIVLHMTFWNESTLYRSEGNENTTFYLDSLARAFVIQAVQDGNICEPRSGAETETIEEDNCFREIDSGESINCEMYIPVEPDEPVTIQVLNPDGEDTVMAELTYSPDDDW